MIAKILVNLLLVYLATGITVSIATGRAWWLIAGARIVWDVVRWPWHLYVRWFVPLAPDADGGDVILKGGNARGKGKPGDIILIPGTSDSGAVGRVITKLPGTEIVRQN